MASLDTFAYAFPDEAASLAAFQAVMSRIEGGSAYRLKDPTGRNAPALVVFAIHNAQDIREACRAAGGTPTGVDPELLRQLAERSLRAAQHSITGQRHHEPGTPPRELLPDRPEDYKPRG